MDSKIMAKMIGQSLFYSSIQAAIGSVEMSSKFSVINFCNDQKTLKNAVDALRGYLFIGSLWAFATMLVMYSQYGMVGALVGFLTNLAYILWIYFSYMHAFSIAIKNNDLKHEPVF